MMATMFGGIISYNGLSNFAKFYLALTYLKTWADKLLRVRRLVLFITAYSSRYAPPSRLSSIRVDISAQACIPHYVQAVVRMYR